MRSKDAIQYAKKHPKDYRDAGPSSVELIEDSSETGAPDVDHDIRTLRNGNVVRVEGRTATLRKIKTVDVLLCINKSTNRRRRKRKDAASQQAAIPSPGIRKCKDVASQQATPSPGIRKRKDLASQQATPSPGIGKGNDLLSLQATPSPGIRQGHDLPSQQETPTPAIRKGNDLLSQQATPSPGIKKRKNLESQQATPSSGIKKLKNADSQQKPKSLAGVSTNTSKSRSQASKSAREVAHDIIVVQEGNSLGGLNENHIHWKTVCDDASSKNTHQNSIVEDDDVDTLGEYLLIFTKNKYKKSSPAKPLKDSNKLTTTSTNCDLGFDSNRNNNISGTNSAKKRNNLSKKQIVKTKAGNFPPAEEEETLRCWTEKAKRKFKSQGFGSQWLQCHEGVQLNDLTNPENSTQNMQSSKNSCTALLNYRELQERTDLSNPENSTKNVPSSESSGILYTERKLDSSKSCMVEVDCNNNAVELPELYDSESIRVKRRRLENMSDKMDSEKFSYLFDSVVEQAADSHQHTGVVIPMDSQEFANGSGSNSGNLSLLSEETYCVDQHRSFSPGAKVKLFASSAKVIQDQPDGSLIDNPKSNVIDLSEDDPVKKDKPMLESSRVEILLTKALDMEQGDCGDASEQQPAKLPSVRKTMSPVTRKKLLQAADSKRAFTKSPPPGRTSQQSVSDAADKMNVDLELCDANSKGFTLQSPDGKNLSKPYQSPLKVEDFRRAFTKSTSAVTSSQQNESDVADKIDMDPQSCDINSNGFTFQTPVAKGLESPCHNRRPLQVEDFTRAFTKSPPAGSAPQQNESDATDKMNVDSESCEINSKGVTFQSSDDKGLGSPYQNERPLQVEDFRCAFMKSPPAGTSSQQGEADAQDKMNVVSESCDTNSKDFTFQSPDVKDFRFESPDVKDLNKSPIRRRNSPAPHRRSPQSRILHCIPSVADRLGIQSSPLPQRKIAESHYVGNHREEASPSPAIKSILKSAGVCPKACKCDICVSIQIRAEKASEFSQRQMRDIETLASNFVRELNSLRIIVEENLTLETVQFTVEEKKAAVASALEVEETTKKWIGMMSRDCNRFCQIMKRPVDKTPNISEDCQKQQKKLMFADEAGKELCHFKIFGSEDDTENKID